MPKIHVEVFIASQLLSQERDTFSSDDLKDRIKREFNDERPGVSTHISAHCVANAPLNVAVGYNYLWRIQNNEFRTFRPSQDSPVPKRQLARVQPLAPDVPKKYHYLLRDEY